MAEDKKEFHQFECEEDVPADFCGDYMYLRLILRFINIFDGSVKKFKQYVISNKNKSPTMVDMGITSDETFKSYHKKALLPCLNKRTSQFMSEVHIPEMQKFVKSHPKLKKIWAKHGMFLDNLMDELQSFAKILHQAFIATNGTDLNINQTVADIFGFPMPPSDFESDIFISPDPFRALLSHSCHQNIFTTLINDKMIWVAAVPIKAGDRITYSRVTKFCADSRKKRHENLKLDWNIECDCEACVNVWPPYNLLPKRDYNYSSSPVWQSMNYVYRQSEKAKLKRYEKCRDYINNNYEKLWPSVELYWAFDEMESLFENASLHQSFDV